LFAEIFQERGWSVWWDRKIPPGKSFDETISCALNMARCVVVLWSKTSVVSHWVKEEASEARRRNVLIPVMIEDVEIPLGFRSIQSAQLIGWNGDLGFSEYTELQKSIAIFLKVQADREIGISSEYTHQYALQNERKTGFFRSKTNKTFLLGLIRIFIVLLGVLMVSAVFIGPKTPWGWLGIFVVLIGFLFRKTIQKI